MKKLARNLPPAASITSLAADSASWNTLPGNTSWLKTASTVNSRPAPTVVMTMARGMSRCGSRVSSARVETASKPRNDRHSTAAPAINGAKPGWLPSPTKGRLRSSEGMPARCLTAMATNTTAKTNWAPTITLLMPATELMPITLSTVTRPIAASTKTQAGTIGKAMLRNRPMSR